MIPSNAFAVLSFFALVTPGLVFELLWETRRARPEESAFREISRVVLASSIFSTISLVLLVLLDSSLRAQGRLAVLPSFEVWLDQGSGYLGDHYHFVAFSLLLQSLLASALAWGGFRFLARNDASRLEHVSAWRKSFRDRNPTSAAPKGRVRMKSGAVYVGLLGDYTAGLAPVGEREVALYPPLESKGTSTGELRPVPPEYQAIVIPGAEIESIAVSYRSDTPVPPTDRGGESPPPWLLRDVPARTVRLVVVACVVVAGAVAALSVMLGTGLSLVAVPLLLLAATWWAYADQPSARVPLLPRVEAVINGLLAVAYFVAAVGLNNDRYALYVDLAAIPVLGWLIVGTARDKRRQLRRGDDPSSHDPEARVETDAPTETAGDSR